MLKNVIGYHAQQMRFDCCVSHLQQDKVCTLEPQLRARILGVDNLVTILHTADYLAGHTLASVIEIAKAELLLTLTAFAVPAPTISPCVGFFCADTGRSNPEDVFSSLTSTLTYTLSPTGDTVLYCRK